MRKVQSQQCIPPLLRKNLNTLADSIQDHFQNSQPMIFQQIHEEQQFIRIKLNQLEEQIDIYQWRKAHDTYLPQIKSLKVISTGNIFTSHALIKIACEKIQNNFTTVVSYSITKTISLLKQILKGLEILVQKFGPFIVNKKMIFLSETGLIKIWRRQNYYLNPGNQMYVNVEENNCNEEETVKSLMTIFEEKCLKTKLSAQLFEKIRGMKSVRKVLEVLSRFQEQHKMLFPGVLKESISTTTGMNFSTSLQVSLKTSRRKRKIKQSHHTPINTIQTALPQITKSFSHRQVTKIIRNSDTVSPTKTNSIFFSHSSSEKEKQKKSSFVISQTYRQSDIHKEGKKNKFGVGNCEQVFGSKNIGNCEQVFGNKNRCELSIKIDNKIMEHKNRNMIESQIVDDEDYVNPFEVIINNGWSTELLGLNLCPLKQSYTDGKEENAKLKDFKLKKLQYMGRNIANSFLPVEEESFEEL